jgi:hypothetical protein
MKRKFVFRSWIIISLLISCSNRNPKAGSSNYSDSSQKNYSHENIKYSANIATKSEKMENDSMSHYDAYQFTNDTLVQEAYINYVNPKQVKFLIRTKNIRNSHKCEYTGTAMVANGEGTAQGSDELNNDELYGVYEYFTKGPPFFTIDIEFKRGKRMTVATEDDKIFALLIARCLRKEPFGE